MLMTAENRQSSSSLSIIGDIVLFLLSRISAELTDCSEFCIFAYWNYKINKLGLISIRGTVSSNRNRRNISRLGKTGSKTG